MRSAHGGWGESGGGDAFGHPGARSVGYILRFAPEQRGKNLNGLKNFYLQADYGLDCLLCAIFTNWVGRVGVGGCVRAHRRAFRGVRSETAALHRQPLYKDSRFRAKQKQLEWFQRRFPGSQGQNLVLTVLYVPHRDPRQPLHKDSRLTETAFFERKRNNSNVF